MHAVTILSPHYDDAIFSLALFIRRCLSKGASIQVLNFYTISSYAPRLLTSRHGSVSAIRRSEDRRALSRLSRSIRIANFDLLDAPLRLGLSWTTVCNPETKGLITTDQIAAVARLIHLPSFHLVLAPLGLGGHIDHLIVHTAALSRVRAQRIAFYEDLPYVTWTDPDVLRDRVSAIERNRNVSLQPVIVRDASAVANKRRAVAAYDSQVTRTEASNMARFAAGYSGGERLWIPRHSRAWISAIA